MNVVHPFILQKNKYKDRKKIYISAKQISQHKNQLGGIN